MLRLRAERERYREGSWREKGQRVEKGNKEQGKRDLRHKTQWDKTSSPLAFQTLGLLLCPRGPAPPPAHPLWRGIGEEQGTEADAKRFRSGQHQVCTYNPPHTPLLHGLARQPCKDQSRKQQDPSTEAGPTRSHTIGYTAL